MNDHSSVWELSAIETHCVPKKPNADGAMVYSGSKEQLVNAGLATANMFSPKPHWAHSSKK
jgi:hypothetical protein